MAHDSREANASAGLSPDAWSRVVFLEAPVCDGCGAAHRQQGGKSARRRRMNVKSAFAVTEAGRRRIKGRRLLLVDDVLTTGATAEACARVLLSARARAVDLAVIARVRSAREPPK